MQQSNNSIVIVFLLILVAFVIFLFANADNSTELVVIVPTQLPATEDPNSWRAILERDFGSDSTPLPTISVPTAAPFQPPTLPALDVPLDAIPIQPATVGVRPTTALSVGSTPTQPPDPNTPTPLGAGESANETALPDITAEVVEQSTQIWQPPPLIPPLSRDALGRDHYWLSRPVDSNATNFGLFYYPYGSDGPQSDSPWRIHHGIDMPNPVGETVRAAGAGRVIWAADSLRVEDSAIFQNSPSYGNVVLIQHDFGYRGQQLYTLYAHLSAVLVEQGSYVQMGDVIGLVGETGRVSGPHVHFEVRLGENHYRATYNPVLWMVPYVGHGVIAGSIVDRRDEFAQDVEITLRNWTTGLIEDTTTSYVFLDTGSDVNVDPIWQENFVFGDVAVGRYEIVANYQGVRMSKIVDVQEGTTTFVDLALEDPATPQVIGTPTETAE